MQIPGIGLAATHTAGAGACDNAQPVRPAPSRLVRAAQEFEAQMMKELLQPVSGDGALFSEESSGSGPGGILGEFAGEALGQALSRDGGFGIARRIVGQLDHSGNQNSIGKVTTKCTGNTVLGTAE